MARVIVLATALNASPTKIASNPNSWQSSAIIECECIECVPSSRISPRITNRGFFLFNAEGFLALAPYSRDLHCTHLKQSH